jgi:hypothetical protein
MRRAHRELLFCLVVVLVGAVAFALSVALLVPGTAVSVTRGVLIFAVLVLVAVATGAARWLGAVFRRLAARLLRERAEPPVPLRTDGGIVARVRTRLSDTVGWRAIAYKTVALHRSEGPILPDDVAIGSESPPWHPPAASYDMHGGGCWGTRHVMACAISFSASRCRR